MASRDRRSDFLRGLAVLAISANHIWPQHTRNTQYPAYKFGHTFTFNFADVFLPLSPALQSAFISGKIMIVGTVCLVVSDYISQVVWTAYNFSHKYYLASRTTGRSTHRHGYHLLPGETLQSFSKQTKPGRNLRMVCTAGLFYHRCRRGFLHISEPLAGYAACRLRALHPG